MHSQILQKIREKIRNRQYVMTLHAEEEMEDDDLSIFDVESGILTGSIRERQKDQGSGEWKYIVEGQTLDEDFIVVVAKFCATQKVVMITVWRE